MKTFIPWESYPSLTLGRLQVLGNTIKAARDSVVSLHDPDSGDNFWAMHCRAYARQCHAIRELAKTVSWLAVSSTSPNDLELSFRVGNVPMKIVRGDPEDPTYRHRDFSAAEQMLMSAIMEDLPPGPLRLVALTGPAGSVQSVHVVEFEGHTPSRSFEIPLDDVSGYIIPTPDPVSPTPVEPYDQPSQQKDLPSA